MFYHDEKNVTDFTFSNNPMKILSLFFVKIAKTISIISKQKNKHWRNIIKTKWSIWNIRNNYNFETWICFQSKHNSKHCQNLSISMNSNTKSFAFFFVSFRSLAYHWYWLYDHKYMSLWCANKLVRILCSSNQVFA